MKTMYRLSADGENLLRENPWSEQIWRAVPLEKMTKREWNIFNNLKKKARRKAKQ